MDNRFPHLTGATPFPGINNIDVYRYENNFDYNRWQPDTTLTICNVPWCGDYDNVVKFADDTARDAYLDGLTGESVTLNTMVHVKPDNSVKLPFPQSVLQHYNYLVVTLPTPTSPEQPIEYADMPRKRRYCYFIDDLLQTSPSNTLCAIRLDMWTTYINDMTFKYVMLERGHAPMKAVSADTYLSNPMVNSRYLTTPDVSFDTSQGIVGATDAIVLNEGDVWFCMFTYAALGGEWGSISDTTATVPASSYQQVEGCPAPNAWAIEVSAISDFMSAVDSTCPQFKATIVGCAFISKSLVTPNGTQEFLGFTCTRLAAAQKVQTLHHIAKSDFGYAEPYSSIAKLYTYPYACIRLFDDTGASDIVRIEDTTGTLELRTCASLVFPWINIDGSVLGIGGVDDTLTFQTATGRSYTYGGRFSEYLKRWDVPVFAVAQRASTQATWAHLYDRAQAQLAASNALASAQASNATANTNAVNSNNTAYTNASNSASNITANNAVSVAANTAMADRAQQYATLGANLSNATNADNTSEDNAMTLAQLEATNAALGVAATNNNAQAAVTTASYVAAGVGDLLTLDGGGAASNFVNAITSAVGWSAANQSNAVSQSNAQSIAAATIAANQGKLTHNTVFSSTATSNQNAQLAADTSTKNSAQTSIANNNASLMTTNAGNTRTTGNANANRTKSTADANAQRSYDTAISAISNTRAQQGLNAPATYGASANGQTAATRPLGLFCQVLTQRPGAIASAGDQFLRYGYQLGQQWEVTDLNVMPHFTYWECSELWCTGSGNTIESAQQAIKDIFTKGVTIWSDPDEIGKVGIYDNI